MAKTTLGKFEHIVNLTTKIAIENTAERLLSELRGIIDEEVYNAYSPKFYTRTRQLRDSWWASKAEVLGGVISSTISQDDVALIGSLSLFQHGNIYESLEDLIALDEIVNEGKIGNAFGFPQLGARPFWYRFLNYCDQNLERIFREEFRKANRYAPMVRVSEMGE